MQRSEHLLFGGPAPALHMVLRYASALARELRALADDLHALRADATGLRARIDAERLLRQPRAQRDPGVTPEFLLEMKVTRQDLAELRRRSEAMAQAAARLRSLTHDPGWSRDAPEAMLRLVEHVVRLQPSLALLATPRTPPSDVEAVLRRLTACLDAARAASFDGPWEPDAGGAGDHSARP